MTELTGQQLKPRDVILRIDAVTDEIRRDWESQEIYPVSLRRVLKNDTRHTDKPELEDPAASKCGPQT